MLAFAPVPHATALDGYVLLLGALCLLGLVSTTRAPEAAPSPFDRVPAPPVRARPRELERLERLVYLSVGSASTVHSRLRPLLREVAARRLESRRGIDLDRGEGAREALGPAAWELLRPDREPPADRFARGLPLADLDALADAVERI